MNQGFAKYVAKRQLRTRHGSVKVYLAVQRGFGREIELRIIDGGVEERSEEYLRFCREVKLLAQLDHPSLVKVLDFGRAGTRIWYTTEFRNALSLEALLERVGSPLTTDEVIEVGSSIGSALDHIHTKGHLHRDINATSIYYDVDNKRPYVAEFALLKDCSKYKITRQGDASALTRILTPELVMATPYTAQTDLFMFGALLYQLATNVNPLLQAADGMGADIDELFAFKGPDTINPSLPKYLNDAIMKLLAPKPEDRFASAAEFLEALNKGGVEQSEASSIEVERAQVLAQFDSSTDVALPNEREELNWDTLGGPEKDDLKTSTVGRSQPELQKDAEGELDRGPKTESKPKPEPKPEPMPEPDPKPKVAATAKMAQSQANIPTRQVKSVKESQASENATAAVKIPPAAIVGVALLLVFAIIFVLIPSGDVKNDTTPSGYKVTGGSSNSRPSGPFTKEEKALLAVGETLSGDGITKNNFIKRLKVLKDYALSLSDAERNKVMPYKRIMAIKVEYYRHPERACERLTKAIVEVCEYVKSK